MPRKSSRRRRRRSSKKSKKNTSFAIFICMLVPGTWKVWRGFPGKPGALRRSLANFKLYQERLQDLAKATADFNYHFRFGIVEDRWYPLTQLISIKRGKTFFFPENTYEVDGLTGKFRSLSKNGNSKNWGAGEGEDIKCVCKDGGKMLRRRY